MKHIPRLLVAVGCVVLPLSAIAQSPVLLRTFNNPTPGVGDNFGMSVAALGSDRVLIGAPRDDAATNNAGAVYLLDTNGILLTTFNNPDPPPRNGLVGLDLFGMSVAAVGTEFVLIPSPNDLKAYLFNTNGALVPTLYDPEPPNPYSSGFGESVASIGSDRVLIGSPRYWPFPETAPPEGQAHLFSTNGTLLNTFYNPLAFFYSGNFGFSVAAFGTVGVLIGSPENSTVYLYSPHGLMTFTNPIPAFGGFGHSVAAVGVDRVLVGAPFGDPAAPGAGAVFVFSTNGTLLTTITNPAPAGSDTFGYRLAVLGNDRVLISAPYDDRGATNAGVAYVFSVNGKLLTTITNPTPAIDDLFGWQLAALGSDRALIGAPNDDTARNDSGSAYLYSVPSSAGPPELAIRRTITNTVAISWPSPSAGFVLQQNPNGIATVNWSKAPGIIQDDGTTKTFIVNPTTGSCFYRLVKED